jgi:hypothetical protein
MTRLSLHWGPVAAREGGSLAERLRDPLTSYELVAMAANSDDVPRSVIQNERYSRQFV